MFNFLLMPDLLQSVSGVLVVECELPSYLGENVALVNEDIGPLLNNSSVLLSCSPGYSMSSGKEALITCTCEIDELLCNWQPDSTYLQCLSMLFLECTF